MNAGLVSYSDRIYKSGGETELSTVSVYGYSQLDALL